MRIELEKRLVAFAVLIVEISKNLDGTYASTCLANQIIRSGTSAALNYGEAQSAESKSDFIHKMSIVLKELRETQINLNITSSSNLCSKTELMVKAEKEASELVAIFQKTVLTARHGKKE